MFDKLRRRDSSKSLASNPSYFNKDQFGSYLKDLRGFRLSRPDISRAQSTTDLRDINEASTSNTTERGIPRSTSALSHGSERSHLSKRSSMTSTHRYSQSFSQNPARSSGPNVPIISAMFDPQSGIVARDSTTLNPGAAIVLPGAQYIERGSRWMERQENMSLRQALEDMDAKSEEGILKAAHDEATELVWHHQNPDKPYPLPQPQTDYKQHLRKGSHARSHSISYNETLAESLVAAKRSLPRSRNVSGSSTSTSTSSTAPQSDSDTSNKKRRSSQEVEAQAAVRNTSQSSRRRKSSGSRRTFSSQSVKSLFRNPEDKIYEEPEETSPAVEKKISQIPSAKLRGIKTRQAPATVQSLRSRFDQMAIQDTSKDIPRDSRSRSRDPEYTTNSLGEPNKENAVEVRDADIRDATSMRRKDRSPNLPLPTMVSNKANRPIVSFEKPAAFNFSTALPGQDLPSAETNPVVNVVSIPTISLPADHDKPRSRSTQGIPNVPRINALPDRNPPRANTAPVPPTIQVTSSRPPRISIASDGQVLTNVPSINIPSSDKPRSSRPLPQPSLRGQSHQTHFQRPEGLDQQRQGALCMQCDLPIAGKVLSAAGYRFHPECFICFQCGEGLELVAFYPEPERNRDERLSRIAARCSGARLPETDGQTAAEDGDGRPRFYCHLDFHESFSPRCKSCKTPIEGEVIVACGAEWHVGHFFCAECGNPFDSSTPFVEKEGYAWCINCHTNRYSTKCQKCRRPVADMVIKALGAEWHETCFNCSECNSSFEDGKFFVRSDTQLPVCVRCEQRRLKA